MFVRSNLTGILNGIDPRSRDPAGDPYLAEPFDSTDMDGKLADKLALQTELGLPADAIGAVDRVGRTPRSARRASS